MRFKALLVAFSWAFATLCVSAAVAADGLGMTGRQAAAKPLALTEFTALNIVNAGPEKAYGAIYFIDGLDPSAPAAEDFKPTYPYLQALNSRFGWDVFNARYPHSDPDVAQSIPRSLQFVGKRIAALKAQGYKRVVIAGQSWGAWLSINLANVKDVASNLDGLLIVAPAAYGSRIWHGKDNPYYLQNLTDYVRHIKTVRTPTVAVFFDGDAYDPGERGDLTDAFYRRSETPLLLIDRPAGFIGHGAGWLPPFADRFAACIDTFLRTPGLSTPGPRRCQGSDPATPEKDEPVEAQLMNDRHLAPVKPADLAGRQFILTSPEIEVRVLTFGPDNVEIATADGVFDADLPSGNDEACLGDECFRLYRLSDDRYLGFRENGSFAGWLTPVKISPQ